MSLQAQLRNVLDDATFDGPREKLSALEPVVAETNTCAAVLGRDLKEGEAQLHNSGVYLLERKVRRRCLL